MKAPDTDAAYGCYACHVVLDGQAPRPEGFTREAMLARFDVAVGLTHIRLAIKGLIRLLEGGGVEEIGVAEKKATLKKQKPTAAGTGVGSNTNKKMTEKIVPQNNSVVGAHARADATFASKIGSIAPLCTSEGA